MSSRKQADYSEHVFYKKSDYTKSMELLRNFTLLAIKKAQKCEGNVHDMTVRIGARQDQGGAHVGGADFRAMEAIDDAFETLIKSGERGLAADEAKVSSKQRAVTLDGATKLLHIKNLIQEYISIRGLDQHIANDQYSRSIYDLLNYFDNVYNFTYETVQNSGYQYAPVSEDAINELIKLFYKLWSNIKVDDGDTSLVYFTYPENHPHRDYIKDRISAIASTVRVYSVMALTNEFIYSVYTQQALSPFFDFIYRSTFGKYFADKVLNLQQHPDPLDEGNKRWLLEYKQNRPNNVFNRSKTKTGYVSTNLVDLIPVIENSQNLSENIKAAILEEWPRFYEMSGEQRVGAVNQPVQTNHFSVGNYGASNYSRKPTSQRSQ